MFTPFVRLLHPLSTGDLSIKSGVVLAPMTAAAPNAPHLKTQMTGSELMLMPGSMGRAWMPGPGCQGLDARACQGRKAGWRRSAMTLPDWPGAVVAYGTGDRAVKLAG